MECFFCMALNTSVYRKRAYECEFGCEVAITNGIEFLIGIFSERVEKSERVADRYLSGAAVALFTADKPVIAHDEAMKARCWLH